MVVSDMVAILVALWSAYALRLAEWWPSSYLEPAWPLFVVSPIIGVVICIRLGLYRAVVRFMNTQAIRAVSVGVGLLAASLYGLVALFDIEPFPRSVPVSFALAAVVYVGGTRIAVRSYYHWLIRYFVSKEPVLIYGAGGSGVQLAGLLEGGAEYAPVGFLDDDASLWNSSIAGLPVFNPLDLSEIIDRQQVTHLLLALPDIGASRRREILEYVSEFPLHVKTMPTMAEIISSSDLVRVRDVEIEELLGRDAVPPHKVLLETSLKGKNVLITGGGGSIGAELARQAQANGAATLVIFEISEYALYAIEQELRQLAVKNDYECAIVPVLGSVMDKPRLKSTMQKFEIDTLYHAAAYKHVPLVEHNVVQGLANNVLGTLAVAEAAMETAIKRFILVSTDKAVRPTNVMGATKRFAELILQHMAVNSAAPTCFSMVRFGNVLGSSGSVVPLFTKQIESGGPVTVTHPDVNRFFMTIPEAASLVIQAGSMARGGDVFVLDMGVPVKIADLAEQMIKLSGRSVKDAANPQGDIAIQFTGLRPGEKLYEELLIGDNVSGTAHPKILRAEEDMLHPEQFTSALDKMRKAIELGDSELARAVLIEAVVEFNPASNNVDWLTTSKARRVDADPGKDYLH